MKATLSLDLPPNFQQSCTEMGIRGDTTIQNFIDSISIYSFVAGPSREQYSVASSIFGYLVKGMEVKPIGNSDKRDVGFYYMKQVINLARNEMGRKRKAKIYHDLITEWYEELKKINQP